MLNVLKDVMIQKVILDKLVVHRILGVKQWNRG